MKGKVYKTHSYNERVQRWIVRRYIRSRLHNPLIPILILLIILILIGILFPLLLGYTPAFLLSNNDNNNNNNNDVNEFTKPLIISSSSLSLLSKSTLKNIENFTLPYNNNNINNNNNNNIDMINIVNSSKFTLQNSNYRVYENICLIANQTHLQMNSVKENDEIEKLNSVFIINTSYNICNNNEEEEEDFTRDMIKLFMWFQQERNLTQNEKLKTNNNEKYLKISKTKKIIIVLNNNNNNCNQNEKELEFKRFRILHWIRVVTNHFHLSPWWNNITNNNNDNNNNMKTQYIIIDLNKGIIQNISQSHFSSYTLFLEKLGCYKFIIIKEKNSPQWFPSNSWAHQFRLYWIHYLHYYYYNNINNKKEEKITYSNELLKDEILKMLWGNKPISPVLRRMIISSFYITSIKEVNNNNNNLLMNKVSSKLKEASSLSAMGPLLITILIPRIDLNYNIKEFVLYLHEKFGQTSKIQLLYLYSDKLNIEKEKNLPSIRVIHDYMELLHQLILTDILIAPHSILLLNSIIVMQPGSILIELFPYHCRSFIFLELAAVMHLKYFSFETSNESFNEEAINPLVCISNINNSISVESNIPFSIEIDSSCRQKQNNIKVSSIRLYHLIKNGLSSIWLRNSRFSGVMAFDRR